MGFCKVSLPTELLVDEVLETGLWVDEELLVA
jgi:hypothetical protein